MKKICRRFLSVLILTTLIMSLCISASAEDYSVSVEKIGEIPNTADVFTGGKNESFSYYYLGTGFGVLERGKGVRIVDVNGKNHIDKVYDKVDKIYHGKYQFAAAANENNEKRYDLIKECSTICFSNISARRYLHADLFVFEADGNYVVFDLEDAKELAQVPASSGTDAGIFDDDYWILRDGKFTFYDDDGKEVYTTGNKILREWDGRINSYENQYFVEKTEDRKYYVIDTDYKKVLTLDAAPDRVLHDGQFYIDDEVLYDQQGQSIVQLPNNDRVRELEDAFLVKDITEEKQKDDYYTFYLYDYSGKILQTFESKEDVKEDFGYGYYVFKGKDPSKDKDFLICPDGRVVEGIYDRGAVFFSSDFNQNAADLYVINDGDFTLKDMNFGIHGTSYELLGSPDPEILALKDIDKEKKLISIYNVLDGKMLLDTDIDSIIGYVGDYIAVGSASDHSKWTVYRVKVDD